MGATAKPPAEVPIDRALVRALLKEQHRDLANLPLNELGEGWDNRLFRLGDDFAVRLPRRAVAAPLIEHEQRWLSHLAPRLPLPVPLRIGRPGCGFPWQWSVVPWLPGQSALVKPPQDPTETAIALGRFVRALHQPAPDDAPHNPFRGVPLAAPPWSEPAVWLHGDLHPRNLLVRDGRLAAVIDFGDMTAGDPATDLSVAWMMLPPSARSTFRASARGDHDPVDDDTWTRARGWALALGLASLANSRDDGAMRILAHATIDAALSE